MGEVTAGKLDHLKVVQMVVRMEKEWLVQK